MWLHWLDSIISNCHNHFDTCIGFCFPTSIYFFFIYCWNSILTRQNTEFQGSLNDPQLKIMGADKYTIQHEIYALTQVIFYIMTGRKNLNNNKNKEVEKLIDSGMNADLSKRVKSLEELKEVFSKTDWSR